MDDKTIQEAEVVETPAETTGVDELASLEALISRKLEAIEELKGRAKVYQDQLKSVVDNDVQMNEVEEKAQEAVKAIKERQAQLRDLPQIKTLKIQMKETSDEIKDIQETLNEHLVSLYKLTGTQEFQTLAGETRSFKLMARILPRKKKDK